MNRTDRRTYHLLQLEHSTMCMHSCKSDQKMYVNIKYCQLSIVDVIIISTNLNQNTRKTTQMIFRYIINHRYYISFFIDIEVASLQW